MLFTCTLVLNLTAGKGGFEHETWAVGVNRKILGGPKQIRRMLMGEGSKSLSLTLDWGHEGHTREVLKEDGRSNMYKLWLHNYAIERNCHELFVTCFPWLIMIIPCSQGKLAILIDVYFCRLKINHDFHEFISNSALSQTVPTILKNCVKTYHWIPVHSFRSKI